MYSIGNCFHVLLLLPCGAAQDLLAHHYVPEDRSSAIVVLNMFVHSMVLKFMKFHDHRHCIFAFSG